MEITATPFSFERVETEMRRREALPLTDPEHPRGFEYDDQNQYWDIWWGGYCYSIENRRISTPLALVAWVAHLGCKTWEGQTRYRVTQFIRAVAKRNGWELYL